MLVESRKPTIVWGPPGAVKSQIAQQVAAATNRRYIDVRALLLDPVDLRSIPCRDSTDRTRWAPPAFLRAALYQLVLDRKVGEYEMPEGASLIACGNRETDRGVVHRMPTPLASRFVHLEIRVDADDWLNWGAANGIAPEVLFFITYEPDLLHRFDPQSRERAFPCPRTWEFDTNILIGALITKGTPPDSLYQAWLRGDIEIVTSTAQLTEIDNVLSRPRLQKYVDADEASVIVQDMGTRALVLDEIPVVNLSPDPKDNPILATAIAGKADLIISGDKKHILLLEHVEGIPVVTAREALERIRSG